MANVALLGEPNVLDDNSDTLLYLYCINLLNLVLETKS